MTVDEVKVLIKNYPQLSYVKEVIRTNIYGKQITYAIYAAKNYHLELSENDISLYKNDTFIYRQPVGRAKRIPENIFLGKSSDQTFSNYL